MSLNFLMHIPLLFAQAPGLESASVIPGEFSFTVLGWLAVYVLMLVVWAVASTKTTIDARITFGRSMMVRWVSAAMGLLAFVAIPATIPRLLLPCSVLLLVVPVLYSVVRFYRLGGTGLMRATIVGSKHTLFFTYRMTLRLVTAAVELLWTVLQALLKFDWAALKNLPDMAKRAGERVQQVVSPSASQEVVLVQESGLPLDIEADPRLKAFPKSVMPRIMSLLQQGFGLQASEILLSVPAQGNAQIGFKTDGALINGPALSREEGVLVARAIKTVAGLNATVDTQLQDGVLVVMCGGKRSDIFVEALPSNAGETIVLRTTARELALIEAGLGGLGIDDAALAAIRKLIGQNEGLVLVVGRPDSGKGTTIYAAINEIGQLGKSVVMVEKSPRLRLEHVPQIRLGGNGGAGFAAAVNTALRHDPDVLVVRDIHDRETAEVCMKAAAAGRLVIAGFHADDAADAVQRLLALGVDRGLIRLSVAGIIAQRLARVLCEACKTAYQPTAELAGKLGMPLTESLRFQREVGCQKCRGSGFQGRTGIFELLPMTEATKALLAADAPPQGGRQTIRGALARSLRQSAIAKVYHGVTSVNEIARVLK